MIFGFAVKRINGSTTFGVVKANSEVEANQQVSEEAKNLDMAEGDTILIIDAEEALSQYGGVALLIPAEL